jgi:hypothetical protein
MRLYFDKNTAEAQYVELLTKPVGYVFKITANYETVMRRIEETIPDGQTFEAYPITVGTSLFTEYGPDHAIVTVNETL